MCMKNLLSTCSKYTARALVLVAVCGLSGSCTDDFILDDEKPSWLNSSIYDGLKNDGRFTYYIRLLEDPDINPIDSATGDYKQRPLSEILSRTGSKTVFVANDEAWEKFFRHNATLAKNNPWHNATSYANLSQAQKKLLIHGSMLNNAIVMENLASSDGGKDPDGNQTSPQRGVYMRRYTDVVNTDTVTYLAPDEVPYAYNAEKVYEPEYNKDGSIARQFVPEPNYWLWYKKSGKGIHYVSDSTANMMLHFTSEHMANNDITDADFEKFMGRTRRAGDVHIYDALLISQDSVAENGYINQTEKVIAPLPNMAEVIRTSGRTNIFSHMLDRFSYPVYSKEITKAYNTLHPEAPIDSIFIKRYFASFGADHKSTLTNPLDKREFQDSDGKVYLKYDPGWNEFYDEKDQRADMATMFVPSDDCLWEYFNPNGGGWQLVMTYSQTYSKNPNIRVEKGDYATLYDLIDDIPLSTLQALIKVIQFPSFTAAVPSKMVKLPNDANEDLFDPTDVDQIDTCFIANNGAVYIMNKVYGPADYTSVAAPAYISKTNRIMKWAIYNGDVEEKDQMHINYFAYLKAMKSKFTFFLPSDVALLNYYDPVSFTSNKKRILSMTYTGSDKDTWPLTTALYEFDLANGTRGAQYPRTETISQKEVVNRLKDILESHTIVHSDSTNSIDSEDEYYIAKNGSALKVIRDADGTIIGVKGGFQLENDRHGIFQDENGINEIKIPEGHTHNMTNGRTYVLDDSPIIPASKSVYGILNEDTTENNPFKKFFALTIPNDTVIEVCGLVASKTAAKDKPRLISKYHTFIDRASETGNGGGVDQNVQFFNNYRYTLLVPTNEAIQKAIDNELPTWESIEADWHSLPTYNDLKDSIYNGKAYIYFVINDNRKDDDGHACGDTIWLSEIEKSLKTSTVMKKDVKALLADNVPCLRHTDSLRIQAKITYINNFIRGHFLDNSIFADKSERRNTEFVTSSYNSKLGVFVKVNVQRVKTGGETKMIVQDENGGQPLTVTEIKNLMARDIVCTRNGKNKTPTGEKSLNNIIIQGSSFAVIHQIPGVLNHTALVDGKYKVHWEDANQAAAYIRAHAIQDESAYSRKIQQLKQDYE